MKAPVANLHRMIRDSLHNLLANGLPSREKHRQISQKNLSRDFGDFLATHSSRKNCVFCTNRVKSMIVFKKNLVFPRITCTHFVLSTSPSSKTFIFTHKTSIFFINHSSIFKKRYGFSLILKVFQVSSPSFLGFCVYDEILKYDD